MRYGIVIPGGEPIEQCEMAQAAEVAGWDGIFVPDGIAVQDFSGKPMALDWFWRKILFRVKELIGANPAAESPFSPRRSNCLSKQLARDPTGSTDWPSFR